jgi:ATP-dependent DNA helicase PIF1
MNELNELQQYAINCMLANINIYITGPGGTGKTYIINEVVKLLKQSRKKVGVTALTGIAATLLNANTLHSFLGIGLGDKSVEALTAIIKTRSLLLKRWKELDVLIIDEISMLSPILFDKLNLIAKAVRENDKPFGGIQLILSGDFLQLPCIVKNDQKDLVNNRFCFQAECWKECVSETIYLTEIIRQEDKQFQECLNKVRLGIVDEQVEELLSERIGVELKNEFGILPTKLYPTNDLVDLINNNELSKLIKSGNELHEYKMKIKQLRGDPTYVNERIKNNCTALIDLKLAIGAQVMLLVNLNTEQKLANGSRGIITGFTQDKKLPIVKFLNGVECLVDEHVWEIKNGDKVELKLTQIPLKLAYAISIHKSQGSTLDYMIVDLSNVFEYAQVYVAISRCKTLSGLSIVGINFQKIKAHPLALEYYNKLLTN